MAEGVPFRISWTPKVAISDEGLASQLEASKGYPREQRGVHPHPVAVVGGALSVKEHLDELRGWPGEIWAINSMADWLQERGIDCWLFTVDSGYIELKAGRALLASCCHPEMFKRDVRVFDMVEHAPDGITGGVTTATRAPALAIKLGYPGVVFFGCDSSFAGQSHVAYAEESPLQVIVRANGSDYITVPEYLLQADNLALLLRTFPDFFTNRGGGLLPAMVADDQWEVVGVSDALRTALIEQNGETPFNTAYVCPST